MPPAHFRLLSEAEIYALSDDDTIAYAVDARRRGHQDAHDLAIDLICYGHEGRVRSRLRLGGVPEHKLDELTADVIARAIGASFDERSPGQFFAWLDTITRRARADFFRSPESRTGWRETGLADEHEGEEGGRAAQGWEDFPHERLEAADVVQRVLDSLENDMHREVIELFVLRDRPAKEVAERLGTSVDNVSQVKRRFLLTLTAMIEDVGP